MCPECITSVAMVTAGVGSAGGLGAFFASSFRAHKRTRESQASDAMGTNIAEPESASFAEWTAAVLAQSQTLQQELMEGESA